MPVNHDETSPGAMIWMIRRMYYLPMSANDGLFGSIKAVRRSAELPRDVRAAFFPIGAQLPAPFGKRMTPATYQAVTALAGTGQEEYPRSRTRIRRDGELSDNSGEA